MKEMTTWCLFIKFITEHVRNKDQAHVSAWLRNSGLRLCRHRWNQKIETIKRTNQCSAAFHHKENRLVVTIQVVKIGVLESARRFRDELQRRLNLALVTSVATKE